MANLFTILKNIENDPLFSAFINYRKTETEESLTCFLSRLYEANAQDDFSSYVKTLILYDVNAFSVGFANHKPVSEFIVNAFLKDFKTVCDLVNGADENGAYQTGDALSELDKDSISDIENYYAQFGYGDYIRYKAFKFENDTLEPITSPASVCLDDLKNYEAEKATISHNIESFLDDLPYSNMLLYGERGTGKSSTVHAMLNKYYKDGLRLVELSKENMLSIAKLKERLKEVPLKFVIYIDDLSLSSGDERISSLKAALEGCSEGNTENAMIVATSNRRHIIDEKFSERNDSVHSGDSMQEELSLSDRFGLSVLFTTTNKIEYLSIVRQLAEDKQMTVDEKFDVLAERWAIQKGGRSPRRAKQFVDLAYSLSSKGLPIEF